MPDDHSEVVPLLPIPNRTVKRLSADDSADSRVKVGHCQAIIQRPLSKDKGLFLWISPEPEGTVIRFVSLCDCFQQLIAVGGPLES